MEEYKMREINEIIGRAENLLCLSDRCGIEDSVCGHVYHTRREREKQRLTIYNWIKKNEYLKYMTDSERQLFEKKVGNPFIRKYISQKSFEHEAI